MRCHGDIMLSLGNMQKSRASIAGSERCIILMSFIKLWVGTLQGLRACLLWVPTRQEDVLISRGPKVTLNLLYLDVQKKEKSLPDFICFLVYFPVVCSVESRLEGQAEPHLLKLVSQHLKTLQRVCCRCVVGLERHSAVSARSVDPCYKSFYKYSRSRSNVQACFPDALLRSETCQYTSWFKW